jgi:hypothetical protein
MAVSNLFYPNSFDLFSRSYNAQEFITQLFEATNAEVTGELISNKIIGSTGFNYLSPWDPTKNYITNDLVISNNQIFRCLVANTNVEPDPNNPAQPEFVAISSNNAILNERQYAQIHLTNGNDVKALVSAIPFQSVPAALEYLKSVGGGYAKIMTTGQGNLYTGSVGISSSNNIILDGGDQSIAYLSNPENIIDGLFIISNSTNVVVKNLSLTRLTSGTSLGQLQGSKNVSFDNVTFIDPIIPDNSYIRILETPANAFGSHSFVNCSIKPGADNQLGITISGPCDPDTLILIDNSGLPYYSRLELRTNSFGGITTPGNITIVVKNCYIRLTNFTHANGMNVLFQNCILKNFLNSPVTSTSGSLTLINCSFFDPTDNTWGTLNLAGTAQYKLIDCFTNPNNNTDVINISGNANSFNYTTGPAARFNRVLRIGSGLATSTGTTQSAVTVIPGALVNNLWNIATYNDGTGAITFTTIGLYQLCTCLQIATGSTESTALATSSTDRPFVGSAGILASFPTSLKGIPLLINITSTTTPYFLFMRSLSGAAYNVTVVNLGVVQLL